MEASDWPSNGVPFEISPLCQPRAGEIALDILLVFPRLLPPSFFTIDIEDL